MITNEFDYTYDAEAINRDFLVIRLDRGRAITGKHWFGTGTLLQALRDSTGAMGVLYRYGRFAYLLFSRNHGSNPFVVLDRLRSYSSLEEVEIKMVQVAPMPPDGQMDQDQVLYGPWVVGLLIQGLPSLLERDQGEESPRLRGLNGKLYLFPRAIGSSSKVLQAWEVLWTEEGMLTLIHRHFVEVDERGCNYLKAGEALWRWDTKTRTMARLIHEDAESALKAGERLFKAGTISGRRYHEKEVPFFVMGSARAFDESRLGIYARLLRQLRNHLSPWVSFKERLHCFERLPLKANPRNWKVRTLKYMTSRVARPIQIVDLVRTLASKELVQAWKAQLEALIPEAIAVRDVKDVDKTLPTIAIIHEKSWYENHGLPDLHGSLDCYVVQHVTLEKGDEGNPKVIEAMVCLKELAIKWDLWHKKLNFIPWDSYGLTQCYTFGLATFEKKRKILTGLRLVAVDPSGYLEARTWMEGEAVPEDMECIVQRIKSHQEGKPYSSIKGFVINAMGHINVITRTDAVLMPDLSMLDEERRRVFGTWPDKLSSVEGLDSWIASLGYENEMDTIRSALKNMRGSLNRGDLSKLLKAYGLNRGKARMVINRRLLEDFNVRIQMSRAKGASLDFLAFKRHFHWERQSDQVLRYAGGERDEISAGVKYARASHLYQVEALPGSPLFFPELLPTFETDLVRQKEYTVVPAGFKLLRELYTERDNED